MRAYVRPVVPYRYSMGVYLVKGYPNQYYRFSTIELDNDGIKLVNTGKPIKYIWSGYPDTSSSIKYFLILVAETKSYAGNPLPSAAYAFKINTNTGSWTWLGSGLLKRGLSWTGSVYYGHMVWTDGPGDPESNYYVYGWWNYLYPIQ